MVVVWFVVAASVLYGLHRLFSWMEDRGSIYYLKKRGSSGTLGSAFLEVQSLIEPSKRHVLVERARPAVEDQESGDPPSSREQICAADPTSPSNVPESDTPPGSS